MAPIMESWHSYINIMAVPTARPHEVASIGDRSIVVHASSPCKALAMSANPGGHVGFGPTGLSRGFDIH